MEIIITRFKLKIIYLKNILITGWAGFLGMYACIKFLNEGYHDIGLDNINNYYSTKLKKIIVH